jgi:hypothetical protein
MLKNLLLEIISANGTTWEYICSEVSKKNLPIKNCKIAIRDELSKLLTSKKIRSGGYIHCDVYFKNN